MGSLLGIPKWEILNFEYAVLFLDPEVGRTLFPPIFLPPS
jgi:hypothetical protein